MLALVHSQDISAGCHHLHLQDLVSSHPICRAEIAVAAASEIAPDAHGPRAAAHDCKVPLLGLIVELEHLSAGRSGDSRGVNREVASFRFENIVERYPSYVMGPYGERIRSGRSIFFISTILKPRGLRNTLPS